MSQPSDRNIHIIAELERRALHERSAADRLSDAVARVTGNGVFAVGNKRGEPGVRDRPLGWFE